MKELTKQQSKVLACVEVYLNKTGFPPTRAEICKELGFKSPNAAEMHLRALEKKGYIAIQSGSSRGLSIIKSQQSFESMHDSMPVIGLVAAGSPTLAEENIEKRIPCDPSLFSEGFDYFLKVKGLSMIDAGIHEDDLVAIKKTTLVKNGDLVVVRIEDEVTLKYFHQQDHLLELIPANKDFATIKIDLREQEAFVEGKSVGLIRTH
ncbi:MAG: LexA repressor [SAR86 cluster bacterium BACL1 MAG-120920-bin57]|jgi:repressor LexA|uniref:LexA repressor n=2 Tax=SAR86 cluster TaxID=62672 RepID=A0A0R2UAI2_9GAMM|nr:MAG: LexA repressor [SAR86 cluster bacterium BACL1 MAG-120507-bin14]KRO40713.1 MAG: LexA repressor [SAR86 cluster bacterium BACL1 MAG-120920-bin57]KRO96244.1 MAG: LexA repressor [SAR86 cluster bacterium BACL1 MAG-120820-bin45]KRO97995.1 MAG: LexA repressor [SAR86 cluster bacterium BACL1 MAG-120823-bin87]KRO99713.1 MAG: LexA repressor [SAR86 cluster bacterium BACL1 MAG-120813-bin36]KRP01520.1 MAG: LexA repressor [SAR86 cluster bacterium BACL1 MAG-120619-bin26]KRP03435.1 MAG: LexA repressor 